MKWLKKSLITILIIVLFYVWSCKGRGKVVKFYSPEGAGNLDSACEQRSRKVASVNKNFQMSYRCSSWVGCPYFLREKVLCHTLCTVSLGPFTSWKLWNVLNEYVFRSKIAKATLCLGLLLLDILLYFESDISLNLIQ